MSMGTPPPRQKPRAEPVAEASRRAAVAASCMRPEWPAPPGVQALVTLRGPHGRSQGPYAAFNLGRRAGDDPDAVEDNRRDLFLGASLPSWPWWLQQVHGTRVLQVAQVLPAPPVGDGPPDAAPAADAAVTRTPGAVLAVLTADCLPVLLAARDGSAVGAAHAGWRGLAAGVLEATLQALDLPAHDVVAWIGPGIGAAHYEVDAPVREAFAAVHAEDASAFTAVRAGRWRCDLARLACRRLQRAGVAAVCGGDFDTFADARFYSYRRDGTRSGRMAALIWMRP